MIWLELRCCQGGDKCLSASNEGPKRMARHTQFGLHVVLQSLAEEAEQQGWIKKPDGEWICPQCK